MKEKRASVSKSLKAGHKGPDREVSSEELTTTTATQVAAPRMDARSVLQALEEMAQELQSGDALPT